MGGRFITSSARFTQIPGKHFQILRLDIAVHEGRPVRRGYHQDMSEVRHAHPLCPSPLGDLLRTESELDAPAEHHAGGDVMAPADRSHTHTRRLRLHDDR